MALQKQVYLYSVDTGAFYDKEEQEIYSVLLDYYIDRSKIKTGEYEGNVPSTELNKWIKDKKQELVKLLEKRLEDNTPRELNPEFLKEKNVISLFESTLTRALDLKTNELTKDIIILNVYFFQIFHSLVRDGFMCDGEKYIFLTASAGQIRTKRAVFVKESKYRKIENKLTCGLSLEEINKQGGMNPNKYLAYLALNNSATDVWEDFDIDKTIVVDDFETDVEGYVDYISDVDYSITRKQMKVPVMHTDGCGMLLEGKTRMFRSPWVKGLLVNFDFASFIREKCPEGRVVIPDIYGVEHDILKEDIKIILTKSQFKTAKYFKNWDEYKENFKKYGCEACYCNIEEDFIPKARINYQMLQTLSDIKDEEIDIITQQTKDEIANIGSDFQTTMRLLGATKEKQNKTYIQEALMIYPELFRDGYSKEILKQTKKSLIKQAKAGRLRVNGRYYFLSPDLYAFCEWLFLDELNPKGLLETDEVYCREFKDKDELACLRSPHLYREWAVRQNKKTEEINKWFGNTKCIYTSCHDLISKILQFD